MATPVLEKNGKTYGIRASKCLNGKEIQKFKGGFKTKNLAIAWAETQKEKKSNFIKDMTFFELTDFFMSIKKTEIPEPGPRTIFDYEYYIAILKNEIGNIVIENISSAQLQKIVNSFSKTPCKAKHISQTLSSIFNFADDQELVSHNAYKKVRKPKVKTKETIHFNKEQLQFFLKELKPCNPKIYTHIFLIAVTGMRPSEALAATWEDLDENNLAISINKSVSVIKKVKYTLQTKTKNTRVVPLFKEAIDELHLYQKLNNISSGYICCDENGEQLKIRCTESALKLIIKNLNEKYINVNVNYVFPSITPYGFRHTFGNVNKNLGVDVYTISRLMGHSNIQTTTKTYFHDDIELNKNAINLLSKVVM